jgi:hypothetical protein
MTAFLTTNTAKRAALLLALLGVLGLTARFALASGAPAPRITAHPASWTRARKANFRFTDAQPGVSYRCSLDGAQFRGCGSAKGYGGLADGRHVFLVQARTASGAVSSPARFAWSVDYIAPRLDLAFVANNASYGSARWSLGCPSSAGMCGTVLAPGGLKSVVLWIQQKATGKYWNGHAYGSKTVIWNTATTSPKPTKGRRVMSAAWHYAIPMPKAQGKYTLRVRASDLIGNVTRLHTQKTVTFTIDTRPPGAPWITSGPSDPTPQTSATLTFTDSESDVSYQCSLDGSAWSACATPMSYSGLAVTRHLFEVRALDPAGNVAGPVSYDWTVITSTGSPFTISGDATGSLYPGAAPRPIALTLSNPNPVAINVTALNVSLNTASLPAGCPASGYRIVQASLPAGGLVIAANASVTLPVGGATAATVQMLDTGTDQDPCQNDKLGLSYSGSAHS